MFGATGSTAGMPQNSAHSAVLRLVVSAVEFSVLQRTSGVHMPGTRKRACWPYGFRSRRRVACTRGKPGQWVSAPNPDSFPHSVVALGRNMARPCQGYALLSSTPSSGAGIAGGSRPPRGVGEYYEQAAVT
jgi:hypothetical protein